MENEEILQTYSKGNEYFVHNIPLINTFVIIGFLYDALRTYAIKESKEVCSYYYSNRQNRMKANRDQVCLKY